MGSDKGLEHDSRAWTGDVTPIWPKAWRSIRGTVLWLLMLDCAWCAGTGREFWGSARGWQSCSACDGHGTYWAQMRRERLDDEAEWDQ